MIIHAFLNRLQGCLFIILVIVFFASCNKHSKLFLNARQITDTIVKEKFKNFKIPEIIYKDEWGMMSYKLYDPNVSHLFFPQSEAKSNGQDEYKYTFKRWCKGRNEFGKIIKQRLELFIIVMIYENGTYDVKEMNIGSVKPLTFGRQLYTWLLMVFIGFWWLLAISGFGSNNSIIFILTLICVPVLVGIVSYNCFMSGGGVLLGLLIFGIPTYFVASAILKKN